MIFVTRSITHVQYGLLFTTAQDEPELAKAHHDEHGELT